jgi:hypothetical protein
MKLYAIRAGKNLNKNIEKIPCCDRIALHNREF